MVKAVYDHHETALEVDHDPDVESDAHLSDCSLLDLLNALIAVRGRVPGSRALGVNCRTLASCCDTRRVSRRMRQGLVAFQDAGGLASPELDGVSDNDVVGEQEGEDSAGRVIELESESAGLRDLLAERERELELLTGRLAMLEETGQLTDDGAVVVVENGHDVVGAGAWRPPRRRPGMPEAGVVTLEKQPDEEHAFGPAAALVAEWRRLVNPGDQAGGRVDQAAARIRRWELEAELLGEYHLTPTPWTTPGAATGCSGGKTPWPRRAARRELRRAKRTRLLRRFLSVGLWRK